MSDEDEDASVDALVERIMPLWIAGHVGDDADATDKIRKQLLDLHIEVVRALVPVNAWIIGAPQ